MPQTKTTFQSGTRLLLEHDSGLVSMVTAMTLQHGDRAFYEAKRRTLGQVELHAER